MRTENRRLDGLSPDPVGCPLRFRGGNPPTRWLSPQMAPSPTAHKGRRGKAEGYPLELPGEGIGPARAWPDPVMSWTGSCDSAEGSQRCLAGSVERAFQMGMGKRLGRVDYA